MKQQRLSGGVKGGLRSRRGAKEKVLIPLQDFGKAGAGRRVRLPACYPCGACPGSRAQPADPGPARPGPAPWSHAPSRRTGSRAPPPVQACVRSTGLGRLRTPMAKAAGPTGHLACRSATPPSWDPGQGRGLPASPPWDPNTDCGRPHPGPVQDRLAEAASARYRRLETAVAPRETWGRARGGPGPEVRPTREFHGTPPILNLRPARPAGGGGGALPSQGPPRPACESAAPVTPDTQRLP